MGCGARSELSTPYDPCSGAPVVGEAISSPVPGDINSGPGFSITATADAVYFDTGVVVAPEGTILARASLAGPTLASSLVAPFPTHDKAILAPLAHDGTYLYYSSVGVSGPGGIVSTNVLASVLDGGLPLTIDKPGQNPSIVIDLATNGQPGVFFLLQAASAPTGPTVIAHWDGSTTKSLASIPGIATALVVNASQVFALTPNGLYSVPVAGGSPMLLRSFATVEDAGVLEEADFKVFLGLTDETLYYSPDRTSIVRRDIASGAEVTLADGLTLPPVWAGACHNGWADGTSLYYVTASGGRPQVLQRIAADGGPAEVIWDSTDRPPSGVVTGDACNIYWLTASTPWGGDASDRPNGPAILMYRRKIVPR